MRFIIHEQPYEKVVAAGELRYEQDGAATGAVERWRLTTAVENYTFLRIDLDARAAPSGQSSLFHLVLNENGRPQRLRFRHWHKERKIGGNLLFEEGVITASREVNGDSFDEEVAVTAATDFWLPSSVGLSLLAKGEGQTAVHLTNDFQLGRTEVRRTWHDDEELMVTGRARTSRPLHLQWADQQRTIWLDEQGSVLKMVRGDGLTAVATRLIYYK
jgi:hypothetical protein